MKKLGKNCAYKRTTHKEQDCGELCQCECHKKQMTISEMGRKGGLATKAKYAKDPDYFSKIGKKGRSVAPKVK